MPRKPERAAAHRWFGRGIAATIALMIAPAFAVDLEIFHADSLAGPMRELKSAYEATHPGIAVNLTSGVSKQLAERIMKGDACDVFAPSSPAVIDDDLMGKPIGASGKLGATWYIVFPPTRWQSSRRRGILSACARSATSRSPASASLA